MKSLISSLFVILFSILNQNAFANTHSFVQNDSTQTIQLKVWGECGMCKKRIEKTALSVPGVATANWNDSSKLLILTLVPGKEPAAEQIHKKIAQVGHDTDMVKADDKVYAKLPGCCQYERKP